MKKEYSIKIGDYVEYVPDLEKCMVPAMQSGYKVDQEFFPAKARLWRVFSVGEEVELIAAKSVGDLTLKGYMGYEHSVDILNYVSESYVNPKFATCGRSLGSLYPMIPVNRWITWRNDRPDRISVEPPKRFNREEADWVIEHALLPESGMIWFAANYCILGDEEQHYNCRCMWCEAGELVGVCLQYKKRGVKNPKHNAHTKEILPIIRLKKEVWFEDGDGTVRSPWKISV